LCLISAHDFNRIPDIHEQSGLAPEILKAIGSIFQDHGVVNDHSLQLLHRHYRMPDNSIALTTSIDECISVTKITPAGTVDLEAIRGQLYLLNKEDKFQAYEYEYGPPVSFSDAFLDELAWFIRKNVLQDKISLVSAAPVPEFSTFERAVGSEATVTISCELSANQGDEVTKIVGWKFEDPTVENSSGEQDRHSKIKVREVATYQHISCTHTDESSPPVDFSEHDVKTMLRQEGIIL